MASRKKDSGSAPTGPQKVFKSGIVRDPEKFLYMVEKNGDVVSMQRGVPRAATVVLVRTGIKRERGWMYYVDDDGDVAREPDRE